MGNEIREPGLAHRFQGIRHQHQFKADRAAFLRHVRQHAGTIRPPAVVHDLEPAPTAEIIAAQRGPTILDGAAALAMAAGDTGFLLDFRLVDGHGGAADGAFAATASTQGCDLRHRVTMPRLSRPCQPLPPPEACVSIHWSSILGATMRGMALLAGGLLLLSAKAQAAPPADTDAYVARAMQGFGVPGLSLAIVENGRTMVTKGYGVTDIATKKPLDAHSAIPIGSESKAFTSAALAILVDRNKLKWSDLVKDKLPGFQMYDPYMTAHMTVRDLLTHRSGLGLGEGDLMLFPNTNRSRADIVH